MSEVTCSLRHRPIRDAVRPAAVHGSDGSPSSLTPCYTTRQRRWPTTPLELRASSRSAREGSGGPLSVDARSGRRSSAADTTLDCLVNAGAAAAISRKAAALAAIAALWCCSQERRGGGAVRSRAAAQRLRRSVRSLSCRWTTSRATPTRSFSDGMTEELISNLAQVHALKVISRTSVMRYKKTTKLLREIASSVPTPSSRAQSVVWTAASA